MTLIDNLKETCGGRCIADPRNCECFHPPQKDQLEYLNEIGGTLYPIETKEECPQYCLAKKASCPPVRSVAQWLGDTAVKVAEDMKNREARKKKEEYVYFLHSDHGMKIGKSINPRTRANSIATKMPFDITKIESFKVKDMDIVEELLHEQFKEHRLNGEWFDLTEKQQEEARRTIAQLEGWNATFIKLGMDFQERKAKLNNFLEEEKKEKG